MGFMMGVISMISLTFSITWFDPQNLVGVRVTHLLVFCVAPSVFSDIYLFKFLAHPKRKGNKDSLPTHVQHLWVGFGQTLW
jgi:hypothetical protein